MGKTGELHKLINIERHKRGLRPVRWNQLLWERAKRHSDYMLRAGRVSNAPVVLFWGRPDENDKEVDNTVVVGCVYGGKRSRSPQPILDYWMGDILPWVFLDSQAVAISDGQHMTYATWYGLYHDDFVGAFESQND